MTTICTCGACGDRHPPRPAIDWTAPGAGLKQNPRHAGGGSLSMKGSTAMPENRSGAGLS